MASGTLRLRNHDDATLLHVPVHNILCVTSKGYGTLQEHHRNSALRTHVVWDAAEQEPKVNVYTVKIFWKSPGHEPLGCLLAENELDLLSRCLSSGNLEFASAQSEGLD